MPKIQVFTSRISLMMIPEEYSMPMMSAILSDVCHIIFGCDTSLVGEAKVEQWTINSTNFSFQEYVNTTLSTEATRQVSLLQITVQGILNIFPLIRTYLAAKKVKSKWSFYNYPNYLDRNISEIRQEFNIQIV
jgi:ubiquinone biosynthesis protein Coq4